MLNLVIIAENLNKFASSICRCLKKENCLEERTGLYRERTCVLCMKVAAKVMCCRLNRK